MVVGGPFLLLSANFWGVLYEGTRARNGNGVLHMVCALWGMAVMCHQSASSITTTQSIKHLAMHVYMYPARPPYMTRLTSKAATEYPSQRDKK